MRWQLLLNPLWLWVLQIQRWNQDGKLYVGNFADHCDGRRVRVCGPPERDEFVDGRVPQMEVGCIIYIRTIF